VCPSIDGEGLVQQPARIAFICEGDAESHHAFSGIAKYVVDHLRCLGHDVITINATPGRVHRWVVAALSFRFNRSAWRTEFRLGRVASAFRYRRVRRLFAPHRDRVDVILQIGPALPPPGGGTIPFVLYCDWNMALTIRFRDNPYSSARRLTPAEAEQINARHARIYQKAAAVFTISEYLRESFISDYALPPHLVVTVSAGPNIDASAIPVTRLERQPGRPPTILFAGKEFHRKGGDHLLRAFREVRRHVGNAQLVILGPRTFQSAEPGIEFAGFLSKNDPAQFAALAALYAEADVFCFPTRMEPFGIVVLEAMHFGLPCVTSDIMALPEMVVDGLTGFTVPVDNFMLLADRLVQILRDPSLARRMGQAGRERARKLFTWEASTRRMHEVIQSIVDGSMGGPTVGSD